MKPPVGMASLKAALKTRAVQTLRTAQWHPVVAKRLDCARFIAALGVGFMGKESAQ